MRTRDIRPQPGKDQRPGKLTPVTAPRRTPPDSALRLFQVEYRDRPARQRPDRQLSAPSQCTAHDDLPDTPKNTYTIDTNSIAR